MFDKQQIDIFSKKFNLYFRTNINEIIERENKNNALLCSFLEKFSPESIPNMPIDLYCFEKGNIETLCYWVDNTLNDLGDIHIHGQCGFQKFGIQKINGEYIFKRSNQKKCKFGDNYERVYKTINEELQKIIKASIECDTNTIKTSQLNQVFAAKLTYLYNKEKWIPIYVTPAIEKVLNELHVDFSRAKSFTDKRVLLYEFYLEVKKQIPFITTWEFMNFIYSKEGYKNDLKKDKQSSNVKSAQTVDKEDDLLDVNDIDLSLFIGTYTKSKTFDRKTTESRKKNNVPRKIDYQKRQQGNERKGLIGEKLIFNDELSKLNNLNLNLKIEHNALKDDTLGYDITSYDENGEQIYIEVKTTTANRIDGFYLTANEIDKADRYGEKYQLYRVYNLNVKNKTYDVEIFNGNELFEKFNLKETAFIAVIK